MSDPFNNTGQGMPPPPSGGTPSTPGQPFLPPNQPVYSNPQSAPTYGDPTTTTDLVQGPNTPKRSRGKMIGALVGVVALLAAGTFAITQIGGNSSSGGASSPEDVGNKLVKSLDGEDLLGAVDLLLPGERDTFKKPLVELNKQLKRLEVTDGSVDLNSVPGVDVTIGDPKVRAHDTNVDDISQVNIQGTASAKINGKDLPIGKLLIDTLYGGDRPDVSSDETSSDFDVTLTTVKQDGHWYLSLFYTLAVHLAGDKDIPDAGIEAVGASSPEGAVDNLITAASSLDLKGIIAGLNPNEASALQRFAPLFIDDAQTKLDDVNTTIKISKSKYTVKGGGNTRQVAITAIKATVSTENEDADLELKNGCITASGNNLDYDSCGSNGINDSVDSALDSAGLNGTPELKKLIEDLRSAFSDFEMHGIVVDKVGGKWFVSPIGSGAELFLSALRALDRDEIDTIVNDGSDAFGSMMDEVFSEDSASATTVSVPDTTDSTDSSNSTGDSSNSTGDSINADESTYWFDCLDPATSPDKDAASACIQKGIEEARFDRDSIPAPYQYPDCGLFDYYYGSDLYTDTGADFQATIAPGLQCITDAAAKDGVDLNYSSPEFAHPECYVDVNPFNYSGDNSEAIGTAYDCATAAG